MRVWQKAFLNVLGETGNVTTSCKAAQISKYTVYETKKKDEEFAKLWEDALDTAADALEEEAWRRARDGVEEPVYYKGEICGTTRKYSDVLLMFMLKGMRPEKFRESRASIAPAELNKLIEVELERIAERKGGDIQASVM